MKDTTPSIISLPSGLRLLCQRSTTAGAGIFGVAVRAGSADESPEKYGLAHFVEHTLFKGTAKRSSWHIINRMEAVGGELNAFTTKEETVVYTVFPSGNAARAVELIADLCLNSVFPARELSKEREVVIDEILSYRDTPSEAIYDDFEEIALAGTPLAHNILGSAASVRGLRSEDCTAFVRRHYTAPNMVAFYSGPLNPDRVAAMVRRHFQGIATEDGTHRRDAALAPFSFDRTIATGTHQTHVLAGALVPGLISPARHAVALFANIIGGPGMNSLLNLELRERRGLVYTVEASTAMFTNGGLLNVYYGCDADDATKCRRLCMDVFRSLADGALTPARLARAKKQYLGQLAIAAENRENRIMAMARATLFRGEPSAPADIAAAINAVTVDDIATLAQSMTEASFLTFS